MINQLRLLVIIVFLTVISSSLFAQNCTINAGTPTTICPGSPFVLSATSTSSKVMLSPPKWTQIDGPAVTIVSAAPVVSGDAIKVTATVTNFTPGGVYKFRATGQCEDGSTVYQDVVYTVSNLSQVTAGPDKVVCPGDFVLQATPLGPNQSGRWVKVSGDDAMPDPNQPSNPNSILEIPESGTKMSAVYRWTAFSDFCYSTASVTITNIGTQPVSAGPDQTLGCYNITASTFLNGSYAATDVASGQQGTWDFISGPSTPVIGDIHKHNTNVSNLVEGVYKFKWTVEGPCFSGSKEVLITVLPANQEITQAGQGTDIYCDGRTSVVLKGPAASFAKEGVEWTLVSKPAGVLGNPIINFANSNVTTVDGLDATPGNVYVFRYTIKNNNTLCSSSGEYTVVFNQKPTINILSQNPIFTSCSQDFVKIDYTAFGGTYTQYALVSAPAGSAFANSIGGLNNYVTALESGKEIKGFDKTGTYILRYRRATNTNSGGCSDAYVDVKIVTASLTSPSNAGTEQKLECNVVETTLSGNMPLFGVGKWVQVAGPNQAIIDNILSESSKVSGLINGLYTFRWIISGGDGYCPNSESDVNILVSQPKTVSTSAGTNRTTCIGNPVTLSGNVPQTGETGKWSVVKLPGTTLAPEVIFSNINDPKAIVTGLLSNNDYIFTWEVSNSCSKASSNVTIKTSSNPGGTSTSIAGADRCINYPNLGAVPNEITFNLQGNTPGQNEVGTWTLISGQTNFEIVNNHLENSQVKVYGLGEYVFRWTISNTPSGCDPSYSDVRINITTPPVIASVMPVTGCIGSTVVLTGNNPKENIGTWIQIKGPNNAVIVNPNLFNSAVTGLISGQYTFRWTITSGVCSTPSSADLILNISNPAPPAIAGANQEICASSTFLNATPVVAGTGTGLWAVVSGPNVPTFSNISDPKARLSGLVYGVYNLQWVTSGGLFCTDNRDNVSIRVLEPAYAGANQNLCNVNNVTLKGNNNSTGFWVLKSVSIPGSDAGVSIITTNTNEAIATGLQPGQYTFTYTITDLGNCAPKTADVTYTISAPPSEAYAGLDQQECNTNLRTFQLAANTPAVGIGKWEVVTGPAGSFSNELSPNAIFTPSIHGTYLLRWRVTNGGCANESANSSYVKIFMYHPVSIANAGAAQTIACTNTATLTAILPTPLYGHGTWTIESGPNKENVVIEHPNSASTKVTGLELGDYIFKWKLTNEFCGSSENTVTITVASSSITPANAGVNQTLCYTNTALTTTLAATPAEIGATGEWKVLTKPNAAIVTFGDIEIANTTLSGLLPGAYTLQWTVTKGACSSVSTVNINIIEQENAVITTLDGTKYCLYTPVTLTAQAISSGTGTWKVFTKPSINTIDPVFSSVNGQSTDVYGLVAGDYQFTYTTSSPNGVCAEKTSAPITIKILPPPTTSAAGLSKIACFDKTIILGAAPLTFGTGKWTIVESLPVGGIGVFGDDTSPNSTFKSANPGVYTLQWTTSNDICTTSSFTQVTVMPQLLNNVIGISDIKACSGTTVDLTQISPPTGGNGGYTYKWEQSINGGLTYTTISGSTASIKSPTLVNNTANEREFIFRRTISSGSCNENLVSNVVSVKVPPAIQGNTIDATVKDICFRGYSGIITGAPVTGGDGTFTYQWRVSTNGTNYSNVPTNGSYDGKGTNYDPVEFNNTTNAVIKYYYQRVVTSGDCSVTSPAMVITVNPKPVFNSGTSYSVCSGEPISYTPTSNVATGVVYTWTRAAIPNINNNTSGQGAGAITETLVNTSAAAIVVDYIYTVAVNGCTSPTKSTVKVTVNPTPRGTDATITTLTCGNSSFSYDLQNNINGVVAVNSTFSYTVAANANVSGQSDGTSSTINQTLINNTDVVQQVVYTITPKVGSCTGKPFTLTVTVPVCKDLLITKTADVNEVKNVGDPIVYTITVKNTSNAAHHNVVVTDPLLNGVLTKTSEISGNGDNVLDKGESWVYKVTYLVKQTDLYNNGNPGINTGKIVNIASVTTTELPVPRTASKEVLINSVTQFKVTKSSTALKITKAGQVVPYEIRVQNTGNTSISNLAVSDLMLTNIMLVSGDNNGNNKLDYDETWVFTGSYIVKQSDIDNNGNAGATVGHLKNTVSVIGKKPDGTATSTETSEVEIPIDAVGSFEVKKASTTTEITVAGQVIPYTITVANTGNVAISNVVVVDPLVGVTTLYSGDITPKNNKLDVNETWTYTGSYIVTQDDIDNNKNGSVAGKILNKAKVTGDYPNGTPVGEKETNEVLITINPYIAYKIDKKSTTTSITHAGQVVPYTIIVTNIGDGAIKGLKVNDIMFSNSPIGIIPVLAKGANWTYNGSYTVTQADIDNNGNTSVVGVISNTATVTEAFKPNGTALTPLSSTELIPLKTTTAFTVEKTANKTTVAKDGESVTYTIKVKNTGLTAITNVQFSDPMLTGTITGPVQDSLDPIKNSNNILDLGETWTYTGTYVVKQSDIDNQGNLCANGKLSNTANVTGNKPDGSSAGSVSAKLDLNIVPNAELILVKSSNATTGVNKAGDLITYTVTAENKSDVAIESVVITDPMLSLAYKAGDTNTNGKLDVNEKWTYEGTYKVTQEDIDNNGNQGIAIGILKNTATATGRKPDGSLIPVKTASVDVEIKPTSGMSIVKSSTATTITKAGQDIPYTIRINNTGTVAVTNVVVEDPLLSATPLVLKYGDVNGNGQLDINETWIYEGTYKIKQADIDANGNGTGVNIGNLVNEASVKGETTKGPINKISSSLVTIPVKPIASYSIEKTSLVNSIVNVNQDVLYTITVKNTGDAAISNVVVKDPLFSNAPLTLKNADANGVLDVGETWIYEYTYKVKQSDIDNNGNTLLKGVLSNTANVAGNAPDGSALTVLKSEKVIPINASTSFKVTKIADVNSVSQKDNLINYKIIVENTGLTAIKDVVLDDPMISLVMVVPTSGDDINPGILDVGEIWTYEGSYEVKQSDIDRNGNSLSGGQATANGNIINLATVTGNKPDGTSAGKVTAENLVPIVTTPSFKLTKKSDKNTVNKAGDQIVYTVEVENNGTAAINTVVVNDPMVNLAYSAGDTNTDGKLDVGEIWIYKGTYTVTQADIDANGNTGVAGKLVNVVSANGRKPDGSPVYVNDATDTKDVTIAPTGSMTVKKATATKAITHAGQEVVYAVTVANTGTVAISNLVITDPLLNNNLVLYSGDVNGNGILDVRETWTYTGTYVVKQTDIDNFGNPANSGNVNNTATASGKLPYPTNNNISGTSNMVSVPIELKPAYTIEKSSTTTAITVANQSVPYVVKIKNTGNSAINTITVADVMVPNLIYDSGDINNDRILDVNETWTYKGTYQVKQSDIDNNGNTTVKGILSNTASLYGESVDGTPLSTLYSTYIIPLKTSTLFTVTKTADVPNVSEVNDEIKYQIKVTNTGVTAITNVVVNDPLLGGIIAQPTSGVNVAGVLGVNEEWIYTGTYKVTQADIDRNGNAMANNQVYANGSIINIVNVSGEKPDGSTAGKITATNVVPIAPVAILKLTKTSNVAAVNKAGNEIIYTVKVENKGTVAINTVAVTDPMVNLVYSSGDLNTNGKLEVNEEWTYTGKYIVTQADIDNNGNGITAGKLVNEASVQGRQPNGTLTPIVKSTAEVNVAIVSAMTIKKASTTTQITAAGQLVPYTVTVANTGNAAISNLVVQDPLLSNLAYTNGDINGNDKLDVNETWTYAGSYVITQLDIDQIKNAVVPGQFRNIASVKGVNSDNSVTPVLTSTKDIPVLQTASVDFKKVVTGQVGYIAGQIVSYEIKVTNTGNTTLKNIVVTDNNATITAGSPIVQLNPGQTVLVLAEHVLTQNDVDLGKVINQADLKGFDPNGNPVIKKSDDPSTAAPDDPTVVQIVSPGSISLVKTAVLSGDGNTITYSFVVKNPGIVTLSNVTISDPKFSNIIAVTPSVLAPGEIGKATAVYTISQIEKMAGQVTNTAIVTGVMPNGFKVNDISGTNENNNEITLVVLPKITSKKSVVDANANGIIEAGEQLTYTITISNDGNVDRTGVAVNDPLPVNTNYVSGSASNGGIFNAATVSWTNLTVPAKGSINITFKVTADATLPLSLLKIENVASVIDPANPTIPIPVKTSLPTEGKLESSKMVSDIKGNKDGIAQANEIISYSILIKNRGGSLLTAVKVKDLLPTGLTYVAGSASHAGIFTANDNQLNWSIDIPSETSITLTFDAKAIADVNGINKITNTANILSPNGQNLQPKVDIDVDQSADIVITKELLTPAPVKTGDYVSYKITVQNLGQNKATGVTVTDPLPGAVDIPLDIQLDKGTTDFSKANKTLKWLVGDLALNELRTITFKTRIVATGSLVNTASATADQPDNKLDNNKISSGGHYVGGQDLFIPNLFTPNGDGNNDAFEILGLNQFANNELVIVNRWGNELFKAKNYQNNWTGEGLNEGTYYYILRIQKTNSSEWTVLKGYVTLIRAFKK